MISDFAIGLVLGFAFGIAIPITFWLMRRLYILDAIERFKKEDKAYKELFEKLDIKKID